MAGSDPKRTELDSPYADVSRPDPPENGEGGGDSSPIRLHDYPRLECS